MKRYAVVYTPAARDQIVELYRYISQASAPEVAQRYTDALVSHCDGFEVLPLRSTPRDDLRPGLRVTVFRRRVTIAFQVADADVVILGVLYGGQDFTAHLPLNED